MPEGAFLFILRCSDGSFYIGTTRTSLEMRIAQHNSGALGGYTATRLPVALVFSQWFDRVSHRERTQAKEMESGEERSLHTGRFRRTTATLGT